MIRDDRDRPFLGPEIKGWLNSDLQGSGDEVCSQFESPGSVKFIWLPQPNLQKKTLKSYHPGD